MIGIYVAAGLIAARLRFDAYVSRRRHVGRRRAAA